MPAAQFIDINIPADVRYYALMWVLPMDAQIHLYRKWWTSALERDRARGHAPSAVAEAALVAMGSGHVDDDTAKKYVVALLEHRAYGSSKSHNAAAEREDQLADIRAWLQEESDRQLVAASNGSK